MESPPRKRGCCADSHRKEVTTAPLLRRHGSSSSGSGSRWPTPVNNSQGCAFLQSINHVQECWLTVAPGRAPSSSPGRLRAAARAVRSQRRQSTVAHPSPSRRCETGTDSGGRIPRDLLQLTRLHECNTLLTSSRQGLTYPNGAEDVEPDTVI